MKQEKVIQYNTYAATISYDYRILAEKICNKLIYVGLRNHLKHNILIKLQFDDANTCKEEVMKTAEIKEELFRCHTIPDGLVLAFRRHHLFVYDADLKCVN